MRLTVEQLKEIQARKKQEREGGQTLLEFEAERQVKAARQYGFRNQGEVSESHIQQQGVARGRNWLKRQGYNPMLFYSVPNSANVSERNRMRLVNEGLMPGWPDLNLDIAAYGYHGLRIEVKKPGGRLSQRQQIMADAIGKEGYVWTMAYSSEEIVDKVKGYLAGRG